MFDYGFPLTVMMHIIYNLCDKQRSLTKQSDYIRRNIVLIVWPCLCSSHHNHNNSRPKSTNCHPLDMWCEVPKTWGWWILVYYNPSLTIIYAYSWNSTCDPMFFGVVFLVVVLSWVFAYWLHNAQWMMSFSYFVYFIQI